MEAAEVRAVKIDRVIVHRVAYESQNSIYTAVDHNSTSGMGPRARLLMRSFGFHVARHAESLPLGGGAPEAEDQRDSEPNGTENLVQDNRTQGRET
jgi:hypothetical protein